MGWDANGRYARLKDGMKPYSWVRPGSDLEKKPYRMQENVVGFTRVPPRPAAVTAEASDSAES